ncbi:hypothetical protein Bhyg_06473 [Pseudolycoriella hygida]|uniref:Uncharacterized protein n=1 Tax=Pseudolycoriella hygida TaxID=35572 RepID=A0A9Q0S1X9_9DIPT|nr:hypothetical protein Bhyg_06473 [Pseudolycoriella hygida]
MIASNVTSAILNIVIFNKVWARFWSPRSNRTAGGYFLAQPGRDIPDDTLDDPAENVYPGSAKMNSRYRFRDLLLGDFAFNDDGERPKSAPLQVRRRPCEDCKVDKSPVKKISVYPTKKELI